MFSEMNRALWFFFQCKSGKAFSGKSGKVNLVAPQGWAGLGWAGAWLTQHPAECEEHSFCGEENVAQGIVAVVSKLSVQVASPQTFTTQNLGAAENILVQENTLHQTVSKLSNNGPTCWFVPALNLLCCK